MKSDALLDLEMNNKLTRKEGSMPKTYPWNSIKELHHHDNTRCGPGSEIPGHNRVSGTGGKPAVSAFARFEGFNAVVDKYLDS